jgi:threonine dehydrogenase-like Zn-dependent dehydrogenase
LIRDAQAGFLPKRGELPGMKVAFVDRPDGGVRLAEVPEPPLPGPYDCRVQMVYGTVCAGTDTHILHDRLPWRMDYPLVLGHESVGRVVEVGPKTRNLNVGDLVARVGAAPDPTGTWHLGWGGFAEWGYARDWRAMEADGLAKSEWDAFRIHQVIPADIPEKAGPLFITLRETLSYSNRLGVAEGTRLLVIGTGGNALAFVAHARHAGAAAIAVIGAAAREDVFREAGATDYFDYRLTDLSGQLRAAFPAGFDRLIDSVGKAEALDAFLPLLATGGVIGVYGLDEWDKLTIHPARARGSFTLYNDSYDEPETHDEIVVRLRAGVYQPDWWLGAGCPARPLAEIADAFDAIARRETIKPLIRLFSE